MKAYTQAPSKRLCQCNQCNKLWFRKMGTHGSAIDNQKHCPACKSWDWNWVIDKGINKSLKEEACKMYDYQIAD